MTRAVSAASVALVAFLTAEATRSYHGHKTFSKSLSSSGMVFISAKLEACDGKHAATISSPVPLRISRMKGKSVLVEATFTKPLPCPHARCAVNGKVLHSFYKETFVEFGCTPVGPLSGRASAATAALHIGDGLGQAEVTMTEDGNAIAKLSWQMSLDSKDPSSESVETGPLEALRDYQRRQDEQILEAYRAVHHGQALLEGTGAASEFLSAMAVALHGKEALRTREAVAEWICEQLNVTDTLISGKTMRKLEQQMPKDRDARHVQQVLVSALCHLEGPEGFVLDAFKVPQSNWHWVPDWIWKREEREPFAPPNLCDLAIPEVLCQAVGQALKARVEEVAVVRKKLSSGLLGELEPPNGTALGARTLRVLVVGAGPAGLLAAIHTRLSAEAKGLPVHVTVIEKRHDLAMRTNVLKLFSFAQSIFNAVGAETLLSERQRLLYDSDGTISIAQIQRALWRVARIAGVEVRRGREFLAYCPTEDMGWVAVTKRHDVNDELDTVERVAWAGGLPPDKTQWKMSWIRDVCDLQNSSGVDGSSREVFGFDVIVAADGVRSNVRDQGQHYEGQSIFGERLTPIHVDTIPTEAYGLTMNYKPAQQVSWEPHEFRKDCLQARADSGRDEYHFGMAYNFMSEYWCYFAQVLYADEDRGKVSQLFKQKPSQQVTWADEEMGIERRQLLYNGRHEPDITVFPFGFQSVRGDRVAYVQTSTKGQPMLLMLAGDAYSSGFFPLGNGFSLGMMRITLAEKAGGLAALAGDEFSEEKIRVWAAKYNDAITNFDAGGPGTSTEWATRNAEWLALGKTAAPEAKFLEIGRATGFQGTAAHRWLFNYWTRIRALKGLVYTSF